MRENVIEPELAANDANDDANAGANANDEDVVNDDAPEPSNDENSFKPLKRASEDWFKKVPANPHKASLLKALSKKFASKSKEKPTRLADKLKEYEVTNYEFGLPNGEFTLGAKGYTFHYKGFINNNGASVFKNEETQELLVKFRLKSLPKEAKASFEKLFFLEVFRDCFFL